METLDPAFAAIRATEGLWLLVVGVILAGLVRGFSGFGTSMIYLPFAGQVLDPIWVITTLIALDFIGPIPAVPRAWRDGHPPDLLPMAVGVVLAVPIGVSILVILPPEMFRYVVSIVAVCLLILLISGFRYRGPVGIPVLFGTGAMSGLFAGASGIGGPPTILFYMSRDLPVAAIRGNILLMLLFMDITLMVVFLFRGLLEAEPVVLGLLLAIAYVIAVMVGARIFNPDKETLYRRVAYVIIAVSAVNGLPIFD